MNKIIFPSVSYFSKDQHGNTREWCIKGDVNDNHGIITINHGVYGNYLDGKFEYVYEGLAGRTLEEQIILRIQSRIHDKIKKGYAKDLKTAQEGNKVNLLGFKQPMLAKKDKEVKLDWSKGVYVQPKLNGHRCLVTNDSGELIAYSRGGLRINSIDHILELLNDQIDEGITLDGELYIHGVPLQTISSYVRKKQQNCLLLTYNIYDVDLPYCYSERLNYLLDLKTSLGDHIGINFLKSNFVTDRKQAELLSNSFVEKGYEGAMFRTDSVERYEDSKRSKSLVKYKGKNGKNLEDDFLIIGVKQSNDCWAILTCTTKDGQKFDVSAPGTIDQKTNAYLNANSLIGQFVNVEYPELTLSGKPSQPVAKRYRDTDLDAI